MAGHGSIHLESQSFYCGAKMETGECPEALGQLAWDTSWQTTKRDPGSNQVEDED